MQSISALRTAKRRRPVLAAFAILFCGLATAAVAAETAVPLAFPGAQGWAAHTPGGRGGKIIRVTTLAADGPGSFVEAVNSKGPRIVVFEVGGVIDLGVKTVKHPRALPDHRRPDRAAAGHHPYPRRPGHLRP